MKRRKNNEITKKKKKKRFILEIYMCVEISLMFKNLC